MLMTFLFVRDKESVLELLEFLREFSSLSGLEINTSKTEAMWLGQWKNNQDTPFDFSSYSMIVRVSVVLRRTVVGD